MKKQIAILALFAALAFGQAQPEITTYTLTDADCSPKSMLMLFRPEGFVCKPSTTVIVTGDAAGYDVEITYLRADGKQAVEKAYLKTSIYSQATWVTYEAGIKIQRVTATPQTSSSVTTTRYF